MQHLVPQPLHVENTDLTYLGWVKLSDYLKYLSWIHTTRKLSPFHLGSNCFWSVSDDFRIFSFLFTIPSRHSPHFFRISSAFLRNIVSDYYRTRLYSTNCSTQSPRLSANLEIVLLEGQDRGGFQVKAGGGVKERQDGEYEICTWLRAWVTLSSPDLEDPFAESWV